MKANKKVIESAMVEKEMDVAIVCKEAGISSVTFNRILKGEKCRYSTLGSISKVLGIPASEIIAEQKGVIK